MKRSIWFKLLIAIMLILVGGVLFRSYVIWSTNDFLFKEHFGLEDSVMPTWYPITSIVLALISFIGVILTYFYRKLGVFAIIIVLFFLLVIQSVFMLVDMIFFYI